MKPHVVTFTGADDTVSAKDLLKVTAKYPDVEWGILFGGGEGPRWPSRKWLKNELPQLEGSKLTAHLCGMWVYDLVLHGDFTWLYQYESIAGLFQRVQLNFHGQQFPPASPSFHTRIADTPYQFIFQNDEVNGHLMSSIGGTKEVRLFDVSHGAGVLPTIGCDLGEINPWPKRTIYEYMGYAGGLGPSNITEQLKLIEQAADPVQFVPFWIDMETRVRTRTKTRREIFDIFDLTKVKDVCKQVWG